MESLSCALAPVEAFRVTYDAAVAQYVVERGDGAAHMRVTPTVTPLIDPFAMVRARKVARALNRVYGAEALSP